MTHCSRLFMSAITMVTVGLVASCASCRHPRAATSAITVALESEPERLDPLTIKNPQTFRVAWQIFEGLFGLDDLGQIVPRLAESWTTTDNKTWVFTIRNARFHASPLFGAAGTGRAVTAEDVAWSYTAFCSPGAYASFVLSDSVEGCADYNQNKATQVSGIKVIDPRHVSIALLKPEPFFLSRITSAWIAVYPKEATGPAIRDRWGLDLAVGTGPFRLVSRTDTEVVLEPNPSYWAPPRIPTLRVTFRVIQNDQVRLSELENGTIDVLPVETTMAASLFDKTGELREPYPARFAVTTYGTFNHHLIGISLKTVADPHLRRAMSLGVDRARIVRTLLGGKAVEIGGVVPPAMTGYASLLRPPFFDRDKARAEVAASSYKGEPLDMLVHNLDNSERVGEVFQDYMKQIGIEIRLVKLDYNAVVERAIKGEAPLFSLFAEVVFSSPEPLLSSLFSSSKIPVPNFWRYSNPAIDERLEVLRSAASRGDSLRQSAEIERDIQADTPAVFLYSEQHQLVVSKRFTDVHVNPHGHFELDRVRLAP